LLDDFENFLKWTKTMKTNAKKCVSMAYGFFHKGHTRKFKP
jgi:hypothetical protein